MSKWRSIETAPKDGTYILLCMATDADEKLIVGDDFGQFTQVASWWGDEWIVYCSQIEEPPLHFEPTHWMPVPNPPVMGCEGNPKPLRWRSGPVPHRGVRYLTKESGITSGRVVVKAGWTVDESDAWLPLSEILDLIGE